MISWLATTLAPSASPPERMRGYWSYETPSIDWACSAVSHTRDRCALGLRDVRVHPAATCR